MAAAGHSIHGEADFICTYSPRSVLDAGCGTGRVAIELATRGIDVVGVDLDAPMIEQARAKAPELVWIQHDLIDVDLGREFDVVAMPGNVMIFVHPGTEGAVVANMARHVSPGGVLIAGFQLGRSYGIDDYERDCATAGMAVDRRHGTWDGDPWVDGGDYVVSVHYRP
jgi:SAM-dependent methyltransferase